MKRLMVLAALLVSAGACSDGNGGPGGDDLCAGVRCPDGEFCDASTGDCVPEEVGCFGDVDCAATPRTPICEPVGRQCVACLGDEDCPGSSRCDGSGTAPRCVGPGAPCDRDVDCDDLVAPRCDVPNEVCVPCLEDADCIGDTPVCVPELGGCVQCREDGECPEGACNATTGQCVGEGGACAATSDCDPDGAFPFCDTAQGECVACLADADCLEACLGCNDGVCERRVDACCSDEDCTEGRACDAETGTCVECTENTDCEGLCNVCNADQRCEAVVAECCADNECPLARPICDPEALSCVCRSDADCRAGCEQCNSTTLSCELVEGSCCSDAECGEDAPMCDTDRSVCVRCLSDAECAEDCEQCNADTGRCERVEGACCGDADCPEGEVCRSDSSCGACEQDSDCAPGCESCELATGLCQRIPGSCCDDSECTAAATPFCDTTRGACTACEDDSRCAAGRCVEGACELCSGDEDCPGSAVCAPAGRCRPPLCAGDESCGIDLVCAGGECVRCRENADCGSQQLCEVATGSCVSSGSCTQNDHCAPGQICNGVPGTCVDAGCEADRFEPDSSALAATRMEGGRQAGLSLCPNDADWFVVPAAIGEGLRFTLEAESPEDLQADLVPFIHFVGGAQAAGALVPGVGREILVSQLTDGHVFPGGFVYLSVEAQGRSGRYAVEVETRAGGICIDDASEPDDSIEEARVLTLGSGATGTACSADPDVLRVALPADRELVAELEFDSQRGILLLSALDADSGAELASGIALEDGLLEARVAPAAEARNIALRVVTMDGNGVTWQLGTRGALPNDRCASAQAIVADGEGFARVSGDTSDAFDDAQAGCGGAGGPDVAYFFELSEPRAVDLRLIADHDALLSVREASCDGAELDCRATLHGDTLFRRDPLPAGRWYVSVDSASARGGPFTLELQLSEPGASGNDLCETATALSFTDIGGGVMRAVQQSETSTAQDDYSDCRGLGAPDRVYSLVLDEVRQVTIVAEAEGSWDNVVYLYNAQCDDGPLLNCRDEPSPPTIIRTLQPGAYFIVVDGFSGASGPYRLTVTHQPDPADDDDTCAGATTLAVDADNRNLLVQDTTATANDDYSECAGRGGNDRVYRLELEDRFRVEAELRPQSFLSVLYLRESPCQGGDALGCIDTGATQRFDQVLDPGEYFLFVDGAPSSSGGYELEVTLFDPPPQCDGGDDCADVCEIVPDPTTRRYAITGDTNRLSHQIAFESGDRCALPGSHSAPEQIFHLPLSERSEVTARLTTSWDSVLYLREGNCGVGVQRECIDTPQPQSLRTLLDPGDYYLVVDGWDNGRGEFELTVDVLPSSVIGNNSCDTPETLVPDPATLVVSATDDTSTATDTSNGSCGGQGGRDRVYRLDLDTAAVVRAELTVPEGREGVLYLREGNCELGSERSCAPSSAPGEAAVLQEPLGAGSWYFIVDGAGDADAGEFTLEIDVDAGMLGGGDSCAAAELITVDADPVVLYGNTDDDAVSHTNASGCGGNGARDQIYRLQVLERRALEVTLADEGLGFDSVLYLREDCTATGADDQLACIDDPEPQRLRRVFDPGSWFLFVDGFASTARGLYTLTVNPNTDLPLNDSCPGRALDFVGNQAQGSGNLALANALYDGSCGSPFGRDQVYSFELDQAADVNLSFSSLFSAALHLRQGSCADPAAEVDCVTGAGSIVRVFQNLAPGTWYLIVDGNGPASMGSFDFVLQR